LAGAAALAASLGAAVVEVHRSQAVTLPEGTPIRIVLDQSLSSRQSRPGDRFEATLAEPIVIDSKTALPEGAQVEGVVVDARPSGRLHGRAELRLALQSVEGNGHTYRIRTNSSTRVGGRHKKRNIALIGGGAGGGALIGALAGGGKGLLIGAPVGAGVGTAAAYFTGKKNIRIPAESSLTFTLAEPLTVQAKS
jgi:hypothetical protein